MNQQMNGRALAEWAQREVVLHNKHGLARRIAEQTGIEISTRSIDSWLRGDCDRITQEKKIAIKKYRGMSDDEFFEWLKPPEDSTELICDILRNITDVGSLLKIRSATDEMLRNIGYLPIEVSADKSDSNNRKSTVNRMRGDVRKLIFACLDRLGFDIASSEGAERAIAAFMRATSTTDRQAYQEIERLMRGEDIEDIEFVVGTLAATISEMSNHEHSANCLMEIETAPITYDGGCFDCHLQDGEGQDSNLNNHLA